MYGPSSIKGDRDSFGSLTLLGKLEVETDPLRQYGLVPLQFPTLVDQIVDTGEARGPACFSSRALRREVAGLGFPLGPGADAPRQPESSSRSGFADLVVAAGSKREAGSHPRVYDQVRRVWRTDSPHCWSGASERCDRDGLCVHQRRTEGKIASPRRWRDVAIGAWRRARPSRSPKCRRRQFLRAVRPYAKRAATPHWRIRGGLHAIPGADACWRTDRATPTAGRVGGSDALGQRHCGIRGGGAPAKGPKPSAAVHVGRRSRPWQSGLDPRENLA